MERRRHPRQFIERSESEEYLHKAAWSVVNRQLRRAEKKRRGALYDDLVAMVFAFHSIEGYLNFVGEKIAPDLWKNEKHEFGNDLYKKLKAICERCEIDPPEKSKCPYSTIEALKDLRNKMTHPKTHRAKEETKFTDGQEPEIFSPTHLETLVSHEKALLARDDVRKIADLIHPAARGRFPDSGLGSDPFDGITSMRNSSTSLLSDDP
ncbi:hypothetical protein [Methylocystis sp. B8]|uniref:hypothetical protein n=1 Tax=Methylocystis sp. B8 TaxID=544938 RepID=UPI0010FD589F|nr:hypothetical protein [Methylocystis sp. B8]TLG75168.1 hypothetical protein FEV16_11710 [Methylocystis sp. B8]